MDVRNGQAGTTALAAWARQLLPLKNRLIAADAEAIQEAFQRSARD
jgi:hypothetical protein